MPPRFCATNPKPAPDAAKALDADIDFYRAMADRNYADKDGKIDRTDFASILFEFIRRIENNRAALSKPETTVPDKLMEIYHDVSRLEHTTARQNILDKIDKLISAAPEQTQETGV